MGKKKPAQIQPVVQETKKQKVSKKHVEKIQEEPVQSVPAPVQHKKKADKKTPQFDVFSEQFYKKLQNFQGLYRDFLNSKTVLPDSDIEAQMKDVTSKVSNSIQNEASQIFKNHLLELEKWIQEQIQKIKNQINSIENVYEQNRQSLLKTGAFTEDQVKKQLAPIQAKVASKRQIQQKYENLLIKSKQIYQ